MLGEDCGCFMLCYAQYFCNYVGQKVSIMFKHMASEHGEWKGCLVLSVTVLVMTRTDPWKLH